MSDLGRSSPDDRESGGARTTRAAPHSDHFQSDNNTTAKAAALPYGTDEKYDLSKQSISEGPRRPSDPKIAVGQESELPASTNLPDPSDFIDGDEDEDDGEIELNYSIQNSSPNSTPPPRAEEYDRWLYHTKFKKFGNDLHEAAKAVFPNTAPTRYKNVYVLMLKWEDEDPNLPVSLEIGRLFRVFKDIYHFQTEVWDIKDRDCHAEVNQKILDFSRLGGNSKEDLKIVYYAGHGKLTMTRLLSWTR